MSTGRDIALRDGRKQQSMCFVFMTVVHVDNDHGKLKIRAILL